MLQALVVEPCIGACNFAVGCRLPRSPVRAHDRSLSSVTCAVVLPLGLLPWRRKRAESRNKSRTTAALELPCAPSEKNNNNNLASRAYITCLNLHNLQWYGVTAWQQAGVTRLRPAFTLTRTEPCRHWVQRNRSCPAKDFVQAARRFKVSSCHAVTHRLVF